MLIAVDIGNTATKISDGKNFWTIPTDKNQNSNTLLDAISHEIDIKEIDSVSLCSVVPRLTELWTSTFHNVYVLDYNHKLFKNAYPKPEEVGGDIIAASIGATQLYSYPNAVVDLGTATNINVINNKGEFIGCSIMPGIGTSLSSLVGNASLLDNIEAKYPSSVVGYSTEAAIQSGLIIGETCRIDGLIRKIEEELGYDLKVIITGGWSQIISEHLFYKCIYDKYLVIKGLLIAYDNM